MDKTVKDQLQLLRQLGEIDDKISSLWEEVKSKEMEISEMKNSILKRKEMLADQMAQLKASEHGERSEEVKLREAEADLKKTQILLNSASNNEEYTILKKKCETIKAQISALEDAALSKLNELDTMRGKLEQLSKEISADEEKMAVYIKDAEEKITSIKREIEGLNARREELRKNVSSELLVKYDRVLQKEKKRVVVDVKDGTCQGCFRRLTPQQINLLYQGSTIVFCRNCNRILYLEEE